MTLTSREIRKSIKNGSIEFSPQIDAFQMQPHAVDLRLGTEFKLPRSWNITDEGRTAVRIDPIENLQTGNNGVASESDENRVDRDISSQKKVENFETIHLKPGQVFELLPKEYVLAVTYEKISINANDLMAVLYPRSSINRRGLAVDLSGIIDVGFSGRLMIPLLNNTNDQIIRVYPGERICQIVFQELSSKLTDDEIRFHGVKEAKYHGKECVDGVADSNEEIRYIKSGKLEDLKADFAI